MKDKIKNASSLEQLQALYAETFGKNGTMTAKLKTMATLSNEERAKVNAENTELRGLFKEKQTELENAALNAKLATESIDVTLDSEPENRGTLHPLTQSLKELSKICRIVSLWKMEMLCEHRHLLFRFARWKKLVSQLKCSRLVLHTAKKWTQHIPRCSIK
jgi:phenylalanyl-tRNA synthetase alpha subunit